MVGILTIVFPTCFACVYVCVCVCVCMCM